MGQLEVGFLSNLRFPYEQKSQIRMDVLLGFFFFCNLPQGDDNFHKTGGRRNLD